jgi:hypothetical protein
VASIPFDEGPVEKTCRLIDDDKMRAIARAQLDEGKSRKHVAAEFDNRDVGPGRDRDSCHDRVCCKQFAWRSPRVGQRSRSCGQTGYRRHVRGREGQQTGASPPGLNPHSSRPILAAWVWRVA